MDIEKRLEIALSRIKNLGINLNSEQKEFIRRANNIFKRALKTINYKNRPGHGLEHIYRVLEIALYLWSKEGGDLRKIVLATLFHDIDIEPKKGHAKRSAIFAKKFLSENGFGDLANDVKTIIEEHSFSVGAKPSSIESAILQDADRLDALGAIGVARVFLYSGEVGRELYDPFNPRKGGALKHFYEKILKLVDIMNTDSAKKIAEERTKFVREFVVRMEKEINLEDLVTQREDQ